MLFFISWINPSEHFDVSKFFLRFKYFKFLLYDEFLHKASAPPSVIRLLYRFKYSKRASGSSIILISFWSILVIWLNDTFILIISFPMFFIISLKPASVSRLFEKSQFYISLAPFSPADIAFIYTSPNLCPFKFRTLGYPFIFTNPKQRGSTFNFYAYSNTAVVGSFYGNFIFSVYAFLLESILFIFL